MTTKMNVNSLDHPNYRFVISNQMNSALDLLELLSGGFREAMSEYNDTTPEVRFGMFENRIASPLINFCSVRKAVTTWTRGKLNAISSEVQDIKAYDKIANCHKTKSFRTLIDFYEWLRDGGAENQNIFIDHLKYDVYHTLQKCYEVGDSLQKSLSKIANAIEVDTAFRNLLNAMGDMCSITVPDVNWGRTKGAIHDLPINVSGSYYVFTDMISKMSIPAIPQERFNELDEKIKASVTVSLIELEIKTSALCDVLKEFKFNDNFELFWSMYRSVLTSFYDNEDGQDITPNYDFKSYLAKEMSPEDRFSVYETAHKTAILNVKELSSLLFKFTQKKMNKGNITADSNISIIYGIIESLIGTATWKSKGCLFNKKKEAKNGNRKQQQQEG